MGDTLKNAADDAAFIAALMKLDDFKKKVYTKANENDNLPDFSTFATTTALNNKADKSELLTYDKNGTSTSIKTVAELLTQLTTGNEDNGVYTKKGVNDAFVKTDGSNATSHTDQGKALSEAILGAKDGQKSILVKELGTFLADREEVKYDSAQNAPNQTAKAFLESKGLGSSATEIATAIGASTELAGKVLNAKGSDNKSVLVEKLGDFLDATHAVYGDSNPKKVAKDFLAEKSSLVKTDGSNATSHTDKGKALANAILAVEDKDDHNKSVLVGKLGTFLDSSVNKKYGDGSDQTAKAYLSAKVGPSIDAVASELAGKDNFKAAVIQSTLNNPGFEKAVRDTMSKPVFDIPTNENEPLSWDWI